MGRNKIAIKKIPNERNRQATFTKRKSGLIKKAMELSILCSCDVALIIFNSNDKLYQYSSMDMEAILLKYRTFKDNKQQLGNNDYVRLFGRESSRGKDHMNYYQDKCYDSELDDVEESVSFERKQSAADFNNYYPKRQSNINQPEDKNDALLREAPLRASRVTRSSANNGAQKAETPNQNGNAGTNNANSNDVNFLYASQYANLPLHFDCQDEGGENSAQQPGVVNATLKLERSPIPSSGIRDYNGNQYIQFASRNSRNNSIYNQFHPAPNYMGFAYSPASLLCNPSRCSVPGFQIIPQTTQVPVSSQNLPLNSSEEKKKTRRTLQKSGSNLKIAIPDKSRAPGMVSALSPNSYTMPLIQTPTRPVQNAALFATSISPSSATTSSRFEVFHMDNYYGFPGIVTGNILSDNISNLTKAIPVQNPIVSATPYNNSNENMHVT
ncbi:transcription factor mef2A-like [Schistocerca gregaria]|uniref:transcription factor mef2A-like n=1 Tax=Schistocerca gregaria TaxID=7010 RepID=UPI00211DE56C|nr:transcription factor mef2A-like [Schistocerca gregaria]XP_049848965.1 transcription factor mef2A-like [Schistocerca gregaria]